MTGTNGSPDRIRVVMVVRLFHPWVGGTERQALALAKSLIAAGVDVRIVSGWWFRGTPRSETIEGVPVFRNFTLWEFLGIRGLRKFGGYLYMVSLAWHLWRTRRNYDVVHVHGMNYHSAVAVRVARRCGIPSVTKLANSGAASDVDKMRLDRQLRGARFFLASALRSDRFIALNEAVTEDLMAVGVPRERIVSLPNGVVLDGVNPKPNYGIEGPVHIVFVGRLHEQKELEILIEAVAMLEQSEGGRVRVTLVGEGPHRAPLESMVNRLGLTEAVTLPGETDDVRSVLERADIFVLPSRAEGLSNALLEAMAHGLPAVVSDIPGNSDLVTDGVNGLLFAPGNPGALAERLEGLVADESRRGGLGRQARKSVESHYAMSAITARYISLYEDLVERGHDG
jgi:glycosyltransferase involved in cell wall biosynthesis